MKSVLPISGHFRWLVRSRSGSAAVEFAVVFPVMLLIFAATVDMGFAYYQKSRIGSAISAAAYYAVKNGSSLSSTTADTMRTTLETIIRSTLGTSTDITVSILINNSTTASAASNYYCVTGYPPTYTSTGTSQTTCSGSLTSGKFVTITVTQQIKPLILAPGLITTLYGLNRSIIARVD
jgi:uncharacterized protein (UPF0333 family)